MRRQPNVRCPGRRAGSTRSRSRPGGRDCTGSAGCAGRDRAVGPAEQPVDGIGAGDVDRLLRDGRALVLEELGVGSEQLLDIGGRGQGRGHVILLRGLLYEMTQAITLPRGELSEGTAVWRMEDFPVTIRERD